MPTYSCDAIAKAKRAKFTIEVELEDEDSCEGCQLYAESEWRCLLKHEVTYPHIYSPHSIRPDSCKANDVVGK